VRNHFLAPVMEPYRPGTPSVWTERISDEHFLAFNFANPNGVKLLDTAMHHRLESIILNGGNHDTQNITDMELKKAGLIPNQSTEQIEIIQNKKPPLSVWLHLLNGCNFNCFYCYLPHLEKNISQEELNGVSFPEEQIEQLLIKLLDFVRRGNYPFLHIKFAGGEPTLNLPLLKRFCEIVEIFRQEHKISLGMISNGSFVGEKLTDLITKHRISLSISVDGFQEVHDKTRYVLDGKNRIGSWALIEKNLEILLRNNIHPFFLYTVTELNAFSIHSFSEFIYEKKLGMRLSLVRMHQPPPENVIELVQENVVDFYHNLAARLPVELLIERDAKFAEWDSKKKKKTACGSCKNYFAVSERGDLASCQMTMHTPLGNIFEQDMRSLKIAAQQSPEQHLLFHAEDKTAGCSKCQYRYFCTGGCPQHTKAIYDTYDSASAWCRVYGAVVPEYLRAVGLHTLRKIEFIKKHSTELKQPHLHA
jgi:uncharacterized protein